MLNVIHRSVKMFSFFVGFSFSYSDWWFPLLFILMYYLVCCLHFVFLISVTVFFSSVFFCVFFFFFFFLFSRSLLEFSWCFFLVFFFFFPVQLALLLLILLSLWLVIYIPLFSGDQSYCLPIFLSTAQLLSHVLCIATPWLQHARPRSPSPTPRVYSDLCPLSLWWHPTILFCRTSLLLPSILPSIRVFSNESVLRIRWPKY